MTQIEVTASAVTAAPPAKLWELLCDTNGWRQRLRCLVPTARRA